MYVDLEYLSAVQDAFKDNKAISVGEPISFDDRLIVPRQIVKITKG